MKRFLLNAILLSLSTALCLFLIEVGLRLSYPQNLSLSYQTRDGLRILRPNHRGVFRGVETTEPYQTNSFGMRDQEHSIEKPAGIYRVLVLGDSFMEALQVPFEWSFPYLLGKRLKEMDHKQVEVINAAVSGWGTDDELAYLERFGIQFKPDLILIAMTLTNDLNDNLAEEFHTFENSILKARPRQQIPAFDYRIWQMKAFLGAHSHFYQLIRLWWHSRGIELGGQQLSAQVAALLQLTPSDRISRGWRLTLALFRKIRDVGQTIGAKTAIVLIPISVQVNAAGPDEFLKQHQLSRESIELDRPQRLMEAFGEQEGIEVIDLLPAFRRGDSPCGTQLVLKRDGHWTPCGHEVAAQAVVQTLVAGELGPQAKSGSH